MIDLQRPAYIATRAATSPCSRGSHRCTFLSSSTSSAHSLTSYLGADSSPIPASNAAKADLHPHARPPADALLQPQRRELRPLRSARGASRSFGLLAARETLVAAFTLAARVEGGKP